MRYKGGSERTWPFLRILNEGCDVLVKVFSTMKKDFGFTKIARTEILDKIAKIKKSWRDPNSLPRTLIILKDENRLHKEPHWLMEFRDEKGLRRLNETLKEMREMLDINVEDEAEFYRQLQL